MKIIVKMFGPFRNLGERVALELSEGSKVGDIEAAMSAYIEDNGADPRLIKTLPVSRYSTETQVLRDNAKLEDNMVIYILPPVAGG